MTETTRWLADCRTGWVHTDGTACGEYLAPPASTPPSGYWCTEHQLYVRHPDAPDRWAALRSEIQQERAAQDALAAWVEQPERCQGRVEALDRVMAVMDRMEAGE
jgi:hypothetical protein